MPAIGERKSDYCESVYVHDGFFPVGRGREVEPTRYGHKRYYYPVEYVHVGPQQDAHDSVWVYFFELFDGCGVAVARITLATAQTCGLPYVYTEVQLRNRLEEYILSIRDRLGETSADAFRHMLGLAIASPGTFQHRGK